MMMKKRQWKLLAASLAIGAALAVLAGSPSPVLGIGRRRQPPPPPPPPPPQSEDAAAIVRHTIPATIGAGQTVNVEVEVRNTGTATWTRDGYRLGAVGDGNGDGNLFAGTNRIYLPDGAQVAPGQTHTFSFPLTAPGEGSYRPAFQMVHELVRWFGEQAVGTVTVPAPPPIVKRTGRVRVVDHSLVDDQGRFNALGTTLFWAAWGYKFDRPKLEAALDLLSRNGFDYIRALGVVGDPAGPDYWDGREISWQWNDYDDVIRGVTDLAYDRYGLRVQWTLIGDGQVSIPNGQDRYRLADRFLDMSRGREHKIILFEIANEHYQNGFDGSGGIRQLRDLTRYMNDRTDILVAASAPAGTECDAIQEIYAGGVADIATIHFDRNTSLTDGPWRPVRQPWHHEYCRGNGVPVGSNNEPIGPGASVASENSPVRLVAAAIATYVSNIPMYVFHTGAGVRGDTDLASMPGVRSFGHVRDIVPGDLASWTRQNHHWAGGPFRVHALDRDGNIVEDSMWPDNDRSQGGAVRAFSGVKGNEFFTFPMGIRNKVIMEARRPCDFDIIDPMTGQTVGRRSLNAGERFELSGGEIFVLKGRFR